MLGTVVEEKPTMTVKVRPYKGRKEQWEVDIRFEWPSGDEYRERVKAPVPSKSGALRWGQQREQSLLLQGEDELKRRRAQKEQKSVPTLASFKETFLEQHCAAERLKPSTVRGYVAMMDTHILPVVGHKPLDQVTAVDVTKLKARLQDRSAKTANNVLMLLGSILRKAVEWGVIEQMPCTIKKLRATPMPRPFYDFDEYARLVEAAEKIDPRLYLFVLLGGDAGLRHGEAIALEQSAVSFQRNVLQVLQSEWRGHMSTPKGRRTREVPMTERLRAALWGNRHLRGDRVLYLDNGNSFTRGSTRKMMMRVERRAGLPVNGRFHILRHTFCSHLAMKGAPAVAIQELAGHVHLTTTMAYMHLSPSAKDEAIRLLECRPKPGFGEILETGPQKEKTS